MENRPLIIAHRGESFDAPENTLASINLAWERNADAVEIDVQLSKDKQIVVIHDSNTKRISGINKEVSKQAFKELRKLDAGVLKDIRWKGEKIPTLEEVIKTVPIGKKLLIEIKCGPEIIDSLYDEDFHSNEDQIEFISFNLSTIAAVKNKFPKHNALLISDLDYSLIGKFFSPSIEKLILKAKANNLDGLDVWASKKINKKFVDKVKSEGLILYVWTVNDPIIAEYFLDLGVDGITTDRAQWLKEYLLR